MNDLTASDMTPSDVTSTDMTPFLEQHDRKSRRVFIAMLSASLLVSAAIFTQGVRTTGSPAALGKLWFPILVYPVFLAAFWIGITIWVRKRPSPPGGRFLMNADDARNVARVARAGFVFVVGFGAVMIASQVGIALAATSAMQSLNVDQDWMGRAILVAMGALSIYFGNAWPRMPTPRAPEQKPATQTKYKRLGGWLGVVIGLLLILPALLLPLPAMFFAIGGASVLGVVAAIALVVSYHLAMKSPSAS